MLDFRAIEASIRPTNDRVTSINALQKLQDALFSRSSEAQRVHALLTSDAERSNDNPLGLALDRISESAGFPSQFSRWNSLLLQIELGAKFGAFNTKDEVLKASQEAVVERWVEYRRTLEYIWISDEVNRDRFSFDQEFFDYCKDVDPDMLVLWSWVVKSTPEAEEYIKSKHPEYIPRIQETGMIPQFGFLYYVESQGLGTKKDVDKIFGTSDIQKRIIRICGALG